MPTREEVLKALSRVIDPEIGLNIIDLGLVYEVKIDDGRVHVKMTMTTPGCPLGMFIVESAKRAVEQIEGVKSAEVELVWEPPWSPDMMTEQAKRLLGLK